MRHSLVTVAQLVTGADRVENRFKLRSQCVGLPRPGTKGSEMGSPVADLLGPRVRIPVFRIPADGPVMTRGICAIGTSHGSQLNLKVLDMEPG